MRYYSSNTHKTLNLLAFCIYFPLEIVYKISLQCFRIVLRLIRYTLCIGSKQKTPGALKIKLN